MVITEADKPTLQAYYFDKNNVYQIVDDDGPQGAFIWVNGSDTVTVKR
jgi:hypothetical protein